MGWLVNAACNSKNQRQKNLIIEISSYNYEGQKTVDSFIEYIRSKNAKINISLNKNDLQNNKFIIIKYFCFNNNRIIYNGYDFNEQNFEQIYRQMILIEE